MTQKKHPQYARFSKFVLNTFYYKHMRIVAHDQTVTDAHKHNDNTCKYKN